MNIEDIHDYFRENSVESFIQENLYNDYELELKQELHDLTKAGLSLSAASKYLAKKNNLKKSIIYDMY